LTFNANRNQKVRPFVHIIPGPPQIDSARQLLDEELTNLKDSLPALTEPMTGSSDAYRRLWFLGRSLVYELFGSQPRVIEGLRTFWCSAIPPSWRGPGLMPLVQCIGNEAAMLPLELMPFFGMGRSDEAANRYELEQGCRDFLGVRRG
jgi:hypothetical protein